MSSALERLTGAGKPLAAEPPDPKESGESFPELLQRLDAAISKALHEGVLTNEVNGGRFRLAPQRVRKKR
jgi:hypothetical protein